MRPLALASKHTTRHSNEDPDFIPPRVRAGRPKGRKTTALSKISKKQRNKLRTMTMSAAVHTDESRDARGMHLLCVAGVFSSFMEKLASIGIAPPDDGHSAAGDMASSTILRISEAFATGTLPDGQLLDDTPGRREILQYAQLTLLKFTVEYCN